ncbi:hypothetical protein HanIR_Chr04g0207511 [Helianthus annuus]|nr:hypothetical protein HanIR_Chr04g0207511 [Helianthus annuus]
MESAHRVDGARDVNVEQFVNCLAGSSVLIVNIIRAFTSKASYSQCGVFKI